MILPLICQHNAQTDPVVLRDRLEKMIPQGYHCLGAFESERLIGIAGYWTGTKFWCGQYLEADNVFILPEYRNSGIGGQLMAWLEARASELGCDRVVLDSYVTLANAHRFYFRRGYEITGFHFTRLVPPESD